MPLTRPSWRISECRFKPAHGEPPVKATAITLNFIELTGWAITPLPASARQVNRERRSKRGILHQRTGINETMMIARLSCDTSSCYVHVGWLWGGTVNAWPYCQSLQLWSSVVFPLMYVVTVWMLMCASVIIWQELGISVNMYLLT